jgi:hypothetical protein
LSLAIYTADELDVVDHHVPPVRLAFAQHIGWGELAR